MAVTWTLGAEPAKEWKCPGRLNAGDDGLCAIHRPGRDSTTGSTLSRCRIPDPEGGISIHSSHLVTIHVVPGLSMGRRQRKQGVGNGQADNPGNAEPESTTLLLVRRVQEEAPYGTTAFRELVERYTGAVFRRAFRLVGSAEDAEEVVQDVFLRVFRSIKRFRPEQPLEHWLLTITANSARNLLRSRFREARRRTGYGDFLRASVPVRRPTGSRRSAVLERAMASLDPTTRMAIALRFLEEQTYQEISAQLGLGESAVKMRVRRGLEQLRKRLSEDA